MNNKELTRLAIMEILQEIETMVNYHFETVQDETVLFEPVSVIRSCLDMVELQLNEDMNEIFQNINVSDDKANLEDAIKELDDQIKDMLTKRKDLN